LCTVIFTTEIGWFVTAMVAVILPCLVTGRMFSNGLVDDLLDLRVRKVLAGLGALDYLGAGRLGCRWGGQEVERPHGQIQIPHMCGI
jgi:hypothetical protein